MNDKEKNSRLDFVNDQKQSWLGVVILALVFCLVLVASCGISLSLLEKQEFARSELLARTAAAKDVELRDWMATFGGIYVPVTEKTPPNPYLNPKGREINGPNGELLTKMNPAYVTRLLHERWGDKYGMVGHITSTKPIRPANIASDWEASALNNLIENGKEEYTEFINTEGVTYVRHMTPLFARSGCLTCHTTQGYVVGDIMGGISNVLPVQNIAIEDVQVKRTLIFGHVLVGLLILGLLLFGARKLMKRNLERYEAEQALKELTETLEEKVNERTQELLDYEVKLEKDRDLFTDIINASPMPMYIEDEKGIVKVVNPVASQILPLDIGANADLAWSDISVKINLLQNANKGIVLRGDALLNSRQRGEYLKTWVNVAIVNFEGHKAYLFWIQDISDIINAKEQAESFSRAKSDFLARMSHEIRTPMNAILGMTYLFMQNPLEDWQKRYITKIQEASKGLLGIINDVLDFSKIEAGKMEIEVVPFSLNELTDNLSNVCTTIAEDKHVELLFNISPNLPDLFEGDILRITQVLINLLTNAIKFTESGEVVLRIREVSRNASVEKVYFEVTDSGIGMSVEQCSRLFQPFEQADASTTRKYGGTGLGLVISDQLVRMMGGEILVKSVLGKGSTFYFTLDLPIHDATNIFLYKDLANDEKILVVDDNEQARFILRDMITSFGFMVDTVSSGQAACDAVLYEAGKNTPYSVVILDWKMPNMNGLECAKRIHLLPLARKPKLLMVSAYGLDEYVAKGEGTGFEDYISKPVSRTELWNSLAKIFDKESQNLIQTGAKTVNYEVSLANIRGACVLLVEDNEVNQEVATKLLRRLGMEVHVASNGLEAVSICKSRHFDLVFMDIQMPIMDGLEAAKRIRADNIQPDLPIVAMTAHAMQSDKNKSLDAGMNDHITKPINPDMLANTLLKWLKPRQQLSDSQSQESIENIESTSGIKQTPLYKIDGINVAQGLYNVGDDLESFSNHLLNFLDRYAKTATILADQVAEGQWEEANRTAHTIKGVGATLGMNDISACAAVLEKCYAAKKIDSAQLAKLDEEVQRVCAGIQKTLVEERVHEHVAEENLDSNELIAELSHLTQLLSSDISACMLSVTKIKKYVPSILSEEQYRSIYNAVYEFNQEAIVTNTEAIIRALSS